MALKVGDIDSQRILIRVEQGRVRKGRFSGDGLPVDSMESHLAALRDLCARRDLPVSSLVLLVMVMRANLIQEHRSPHNFATTVQAITTNAVNRGWKVSEVEDFQTALAQDKELKAVPVEVIELCHPDYACQMLKSGKRSCLAMMPCAVAVYQEGSHVYVASLNRGLIGRLFRREAADVMRKVRADEREILSFLAVH